MATKEYAAKRADPRWQRKRLEIFKRDNFTCVSCGRTDIELHAHHIRYIAGREPWEYDNSFLITYCHLCHNTEHLIGDDLNSYLLEIIAEKPIWIKCVAEIAILMESSPLFSTALREFLKDQMIAYLKTKDQSNG